MFSLGVFAPALIKGRNKQALCKQAHSRSTSCFMWKGKTLAPWWRSPAGEPHRPPSEEGVVVGLVASPGCPWHAGAMGYVASGMWLWSPTAQGRSSARRPPRLPPHRHLNTSTLGFFIPRCSSLGNKMNKWESHGGYKSRTPHLARWARQRAGKHMLHTKWLNKRLKCPIPAWATPPNAVASAPFLQALWHAAVWTVSLRLGMLLLSGLYVARTRPQHNNKTQLSEHRAGSFLCSTSPEAWCPSPGVTLHSWLG